MRFTMLDGTMRPLAHATRRPPEPPEPLKDQYVRYRGWECSWNSEAHFWASEGWEAYKGGADLDAPRVAAGSWSALLDAVDDEEDE